MDNQFVFVDETYHPLYKRIRLGLCCINTELRKQNIFCSRTMTRKNFTLEKAQTLALKNIADIIPMATWNSQNNISVMRISSDIFPHYTDTETQKYDMLFAEKALRQSGDVCNLHLQRITMHPGQFNQVGSKHRHVFEKTIDELVMHCNILDYMNISVRDGIVNVHGGGTYGDKESAKRRWVEQFDELPSVVKRRLTIENCEKCYSVRDCLDIATQCGIPVIMDSHHYDCYGILHPNETQESAKELIPEVLDTWKDRVPLFHISEQRVGARVGSHSDYIENIPQYFLDVPLLYDKNIDIDVEAKQKEKAILKLYEKYPHIF